MEIKLQCNCGQKYKFDVEPTNGQMPFAVNCPICGVDGTSAANTVLAQSFSQPGPVAMAAAAPMAQAPSSGLRISQAAHAAPPVAAPPPMMAAPPSTIAPTRAPVGKPAKSQSTKPRSFILGVVGALLGAGLGIGLMYGFFLLADFRFPLMGVGTGFLTGLGARLLYRNTNPAMGGVAATIAFFSVAGTLYLMYHEVPVLSIISMIVSVSVAYKVAGS